MPKVQKPSTNTSQANGPSTLARIKKAPVEHAGQRVITLAMMDGAHGRPAGTAGRAFRTHKGKLVEGRHYFLVPAGELATKNVGNPATLQPLLTERGYLVLVKSFRDPLAWQVQEQLVEGYFRGQEAVANIGEVLALARQAFDFAKRADQRGAALAGMVADLLHEERREGIRERQAARQRLGFGQAKKWVQGAAPMLPFPKGPKGKK